MAEILITKGFKYRIYPNQGKKAKKTKEMIKELIKDDFEL